MLLFARLVWALQSLSYVFRLSFMFWGAVDEAEVAKRKARELAEGTIKAGNAVDVGKVTLRYEVLERAALLAHWAWMGALTVFAMPDFTTGLAFFMLAQFASGMLIAVAFGVGHNGMLVYDADKKPGFAELQVTTTRNITGGKGIPQVCRR